MNHAPSPPGDTGPGTRPHASPGAAPSPHEALPSASPDHPEAPPSSHGAPAAPPPSPGRQLFEGLIHRESRNTEELLSPEDFCLDTTNLHMGTRIQDPQLGHAQVGIQAFDQGLLVSGLQGGLQQAIALNNSLHDADTFERPSCLILELLMAGHVCWTDTRGKEHQSGRAGELWHFDGELDWREYAIQPGQVAQAHLAVSHELLQTWLTDLPAGGPRQRIEQSLRAPAVTGMPSISTMPPRVASMAALLQPLMQQSQPPGLPQRMQIEGLAFSLLGEWLELPPVPSKPPLRTRWQRAVDDAIDIIRAEYAGDHLTISELSRRTGTNECYLKRGFRERTGSSIAAFIRHHRMQTALALLEEGGMSVREVAHEVGYVNPSQFARAFRAVYGYAPSDILRREQ